MHEQPNRGQPCGVCMGGWFEFAWQGLCGFVCVCCVPVTVMQLDSFSEMEAGWESQQFGSGKQDPVRYLLYIYYLNHFEKNKIMGFLMRQEVCVCAHDVCVPAMALLW